MAGYLKKVESCIQQTRIKLSLFDKLIFRSLVAKKINNCHFKCSLNSNINNIKFNGRYPFIEILCCTEFFSFFFSVLNLMAHLFLYKKHIKENVKYSRFRNHINIQHFLICMCWISSSLFHMNDTIVTRSMDYFSVLTFLCFALYYNFSRTMRFHFEKKIKIENTLGLFLFLLDFYVIFYMSFFDFNYKLHRNICVVLMILIYKCWIYQYYKQRRHYYAKYVIYYLICLVVGSIIEISDTPPFAYLIDSHAVWHAITAFSAPFYYEYMRNDMLHKSCLNITKEK